MKFDLADNIQRNLPIPSATTSKIGMHRLINTLVPVNDAIDVPVRSNEFLHRDLILNLCLTRFRVGAIATGLRQERDLHRSTPHLSLVKSRMK